MIPKVRHSLAIVSVTTTCLFSTSLYATVGGPEKIEVLGWDQLDEKVYLLRHYQDQYGRLPQLYYYELRSDTPSKLIPVKSLYRNLKQKDRQSYERTVTKSLSLIKQRLKPLEELNTEQATIFVVDQHTERGNFWQHADPNDAFEVTRYTQQYQVRNTEFLSNLQTQMSYQNNQMKTVQLYALPNHRFQIAVIEYLGIPFESGYTKQDPALLKFEPEN